jgi:hypothetical protein
LKQNGIPMEFEESPLPARKSTYVHGIRGVDTHSFERRAMGDGRNDEPSIVFETNESTVKRGGQYSASRAARSHHSIALRSTYPAKACNGSRLDEPGSEPRLSDTSIQVGLRGP